MKKTINCAVWSVLLYAGNGFAITTDSTPSASDLVSALLGSGITASNITFSGTANSAGTFSDGESSIGFNQGIILSTGNIANVIGPNAQDGISQNNNIGGDSDLNGLIPGYSTYDATVLEFDFVADAVPGATLTTVSFQYVFASDEYNEYVNSSFNDVFGFFMNGSNIALIPETSVPVSINNVNNLSNSSYYINNDLSDGGGSVDTEMDGLTVVLTAKFDVVPGEVNHIKLAVADAGDSILDSNVFLKADSFTNEPADSDSDGVIDDEDNCPAVANADQLNTDGDAEGDACDMDDDNDTVLDSSDNCPLVVNADQANNDGDVLGDACDDDDDNDTVLDANDNCPFTANADQSDSDGDGQGDVCDGDSDGDGVVNDADNCPAVANADQSNNDGDVQGDACDDDDDNDGVADDQPDNCRLIANAGQEDLDGDAIGDACDIDIDGDGAKNDQDNCSLVANADQENSDGDTLGDACDDDDDNDGVVDTNDNCSLIYNVDQADADSDGQGDVCDGDLDGDGTANDADNCPNVANASQADFDGDSKGDACDEDVDGDGVPNDKDMCAFTALDAIFSPEGCSIGQLCPCEGPRGTTELWKNHGQYVSCVAASVNSFLEADLITKSERHMVLLDAAKSSCGKQKKVIVRPKP